MSSRHQRWPLSNKRNHRQQHCQTDPAKCTSSTGVQTDRRQMFALKQSPVFFLRSPGTSPGIPRRLERLFNCLSSWMARCRRRFAQPAIMERSAVIAIESNGKVWVDSAVGQKLPKQSEERFVQRLWPKRPVDLKLRKRDKKMEYFLLTKRMIADKQEKVCKKRNISAGAQSVICLFRER